jgi:CDP-6-deoxy-D-xylo-4-hexulose-3-dehydrase
MLSKIVASLRDWGRDCYCPSGKDNSCKQRFSRQFGDLPVGYDHKYVYSHFGYNLKVTDMQASVGCAQLKKLPDFIQSRRTNWKYLREQFDDLGDIFYLPEAENNANPSWFGFALTLKSEAKFKRIDLIKYLEKKNIQTRLLFAGNLLKHPCFDQMRDNGIGYKVIGNLENTDKIMNNTFWIGVYPGMNKEMLDYMIEEIKTFVAKIK